MHTPCCSTFKTAIAAGDPRCISSTAGTFTLKRLHRIIETSDWDQSLMHKEKWINRGCWFLVDLSLLYFVLILAGRLCP